MVRKKSRVLQNLNRIATPFFINLLIKHNEKSQYSYTGLLKRASAMRMPSAADEVMPPAIPAPSPAV